MKGYRFYLVHKDKAAKRRDKHTGNVIALFLKDDGTPVVNWATLNYEGLAPVYFRPNSGVNVTAISPEYLRDSCKRISEKRAREIHPRLFERLD